MYSSVGFEPTGETLLGVAVPCGPTDLGRFAVCPIVGFAVVGLPVLEERCEGFPQ